MEIYDDLREKGPTLQDANEALQQKLKERERRISQLQEELD